VTPGQLLQIRNGFYVQTFFRNPIHNRYREDIASTRGAICLENGTLCLLLDQMTCVVNGFYSILVEVLMDTGQIFVIGQMNIEEIKSE